MNLIRVMPAKGRTDASDTRILFDAAMSFDAALPLMQRCLDDGVVFDDSIVFGPNRSRGTLLRSRAMQVIVNGKRADVATATVSALLTELEYDFTQLAIAVNRKVVPKQCWGDTALAQGDVIEIITPRQGG